jgi:hypothetical protein
MKRPFSRQQGITYFCKPPLSALQEIVKQKYFGTRRGKSPPFPFYLPMSNYYFLALQYKPKEAKHKKLPELNLDGVSALYIWGLNRFGYLQYRSWLKEDPKRRLIFLEKEGGVLASCLGEKMLQDPQVHVELFSEDRLDLLADRFPFEKVEVIGPKDLRLKILQETLLAYSLRMDRLYGYELCANFLQNLHCVKRSFYANAMKGAYRGVPAIVCGAGPSLEVEEIKKASALIIAGGSSIAALDHAGVKIHFGMAIDPNSEEHIRLKNIRQKMPLLYSTRVFPDVIKGWNGPLGYMRSGAGGVLELWLDEELGLDEEMIGQHLLPSAMSVTAMCLAWAHFLGCNPIYFNGIDLAYTDKKRYASGVPVSAPTQEKQLICKKGKEDKFVNTTAHFLMESDVLATFAKKHPETRFIDTTTSGLILDGIERSSLKKAALNASFAEAPLPPLPKIPIRIEELKLSLGRVVERLEILAGVKKGSTALAEVELDEELAMNLLFYDLKKLHASWQDRLKLAYKYKEVFCDKLP